ncbi:MAG: SusC/RagA family TonB-linked outer membrane protein [Bacteroidales bacterium]|nr:SusC/RagA family TonB-linked outer membrane protein [Bacteroidales bacterium]
MSTKLQRIGTFFLGTVLLLLAPAIRVDAQRTVTAKGTVIDQNGDPVPAAVFYVKGNKDNGGVAKDNGTFSITVPRGATLVFTSLGYADVEQTASTNMVVQMKTESQMLDELVVVGYTKENLRNISAAVQRVDMQALENNQSVSLASMLAGQAAGLQTVTRSGVPGASNTGLVIRGNSSLSSANDITGISNPLYIIDGVPMSLQDFAGYNVTDNDFLSSLNPQDIQSIDILKDAAATAIYGSRGANGVVIITTRKGTSGKARITARVSHGFTVKPAKIPVYVGQEERDAKIDLLKKTWTNLFQGAEWYDQRTSGNGATYVEAIAYPSVLSDKYNPYFNNAYDFQNMFYQTGQTGNYDLSMEGGNENNSYRVSLAHYNETGVLVGYGLSRTNLSMSLVTDVNKWIHNEVVMRYSYVDREGGMGDVMKAMPTSPTNLPSSLFYRTPTELNQMSGELGDAYNKNVSHNLTVGETLRLKFAEWLTMDNQVSMVLDFGKRDYSVPSIARTDNKSIAYSYASMTTTYNVNSVLNFNKSFGKDKKHTVIALLGTEVNINDLNTLRAEAQSGMSDHLKVIQGYTKENTFAYSDIVTSRMFSVFGLLSYGFAGNRYKIEGVYRRDGSSRFGANTRWANFPSVKAQWAFSEEPWLKPVTGAWLDFGKLRVSYGTSGEIYYDPLLQYNSLVAPNGFGSGVLWASSNKMDVKTYGGNLSLVSDFDKIANKDLTWSWSKEVDYGLDLELFGRRLNMTFDIYSRYISNLVYTSQLPAYVGFNRISSNLVDMVGHGFEASLTAYLFPRTSKVQWDWTLNLGNNHMVIAKMGNGGKDYINTDENYAFIQGAPAFQYYMHEYQGALDNFSDLPVNPLTGEALTYYMVDMGLARNLQGRIFPGCSLYTDVDGDYYLRNDESDMKVIEGKTAEPKITGGLSTGFKYKNFSFRINTSFAFGHWIFNTTLYEQLSRLDNSSDFYQYALYKFDESKFWSGPGDNSYYPMLYVNYWEGGGASIYRKSSMYLERGDYWSIDNINVSYNLPDKWMSKIHLRGINVYLNVSNVAMFKASSVLDPRKVSRIGFYNGEGYPLSQTFVIGTQIQF